MTKYAACERGTDLQRLAPIPVGRGAVEIGGQRMVDLPFSEQLPRFCRTAALAGGAVVVYSQNEIDTRFSTGCWGEAVALATRRALIVVAATVVFMVSLWFLGLGFGHELRLSRWLGRPFLGSTVYFGTWFIFVATLVFGLGIPYIVVRLVLHQPLRDFGFSLGEARQGVVWLLVFTPGCVLVPLVSAFIGTERYYSYLVDPGFLTPVNVALHCASYGMFVFGFEGLFRGLLLFGLAQALGGSRGGQWTAVLLPAALSALSLIGLPWIFPVSALLAGVPAGFLNLRLRSFVYFALIHWSIGIWSDVWEIIKLNVAHGMW